MAAGSAPQALAQGSQYTITTPAYGQSSPKTGPLPERFAEIVRKSCREEQDTEVCHAQICEKKASVFAAKLCGKLCDPRQRFLATPSRHAIRQTRSKTLVRLGMTTT